MDERGTEVLLGGDVHQTDSKSLKHADCVQQKVHYVSHSRLHCEFGLENSGVVGGRSVAEIMKGITQIFLGHHAPLREGGAALEKVPQEASRGVSG